MPNAAHRATHILLNTCSYTRKKINDSSIPFEYLGEEINEELSPYDFMDK